MERHMKVHNLFQRANFSGVLQTEELFKSKLTQKAKIEIAEIGSTASASTMLGVTAGGQSGRFKCDHPFLFMIHDQKFNEILFAGIYRGPNVNQNETWTTCVFA